MRVDKFELGNYEKVLSREYLNTLSLYYLNKMNKMRGTSDHNKKSRGLPTGQFIVGIIIILAGILLLLETTDIYPTGDILRFVPSLFIILGFWVLIKIRLQSFLGPVILILFASGWQLIALDYATWGQIFDLWPVVLILIGIYLIIGRYRSRVRESDSAYISSFVVFGDVNKRNTSSDFTSGELRGIFSDIILDLRDAKISDVPARVSVSVLFSDVDIRVPDEWNVQIDTLPILAEGLDRRRKSEEEHEEVDLIVDGIAVFSDVYIKE